MDAITSTSNSTVKRLRKLMTQPKARREENLAIAEGIHVVEGFMATGMKPEMTVVAASALQNAEVVSLSAHFSESIVLADSLFESVFTIHASVGVAMVFTPPTPDLPEHLSFDAVLLEDVQDPGNLGTILRTAAASGVHNVLLSSDCASPWSPKALRAGMGAQFSLALYENVSLADAIKNAEIPVYATTLSEHSQSLYTLDLKQSAAWVFGNEGQGVSAALTEHADAQVYIPQAEHTVESLNVAAATAVCLYEQYRQRSLS